ncbi:sulfotransferase ssu-1-like [Dermacentor albipictus]|uniref:sulfotransferase ssu-1-like n=1 Tax=Dermacentor albipictus TaxID=60249 RepID=UPI0038FC588B
MDEDSYRYVEGMWLHKLFKDEAIISAVNYKPRQGDVFVDTYPKCGTNWMQFIVYNILTRAAPVTNLGAFRLMSPFIEMTGASAAENPLRNGPVMTHFPYNVLRPVDKAKYIYVARNPYDCAVSFYHFIKGLTPKTVTDVSFEKFLNLYLAGKVLYGDYFDHLLPWTQPSVLHYSENATRLQASTKKGAVRWKVKLSKAKRATSPSPLARHCQPMVLKQIALNSAPPRLQEPALLPCCQLPLVTHCLVRNKFDLEVPAS